MDSWRLPTSLSVGGVDRPIRTDFRCILDILRMLDDRDLPSWAQTVCLIKMLFIDWKTIPQEQYTEACEKAMSFIDNGKYDKLPTAVKANVVLDNDGNDQ